MHTRFHSQTLPQRLATQVRERLAAAHADQPFSPLDTRNAARRVASIADAVGLAVTIYRGGLDLRGVEVDHVWLAATQPAQADRPFVLDVAFPLFDPEFVLALRSFVAGDLSREQLAAAAHQGGVDRRVVGEIPPPIRYLGTPVWSAR